MAGDTLIVGYDLESEPTVRDTFILISNLLSGVQCPMFSLNPLSCHLGYEVH